MTELKQLSIDEGSQATGRTSYLDILRQKLSVVDIIEYSVAAIIICLALILFTILFSRQSIKSLVPFSSLSSCTSYTEVYSLVPQTVSLAYPATVSFLDYDTSYLYPGYANVTFNAKWSSCFLESDDDNFALTPDTEVLYQPVNISISDASQFKINGSVSSNDGCFQLYCDAEYTYIYDAKNPRKNYNQFLKDSTFLLLPSTSNLDEQIVNGSRVLVNNQLITSITSTDNSVTASCAVSIEGYYLQIFTQSNSVTTTGTYLCTQYTSNFQSLSSGLSFALTALFLCRVYFYSKFKEVQ